MVPQRPSFIGKPVQATRDAQSHPHALPEQAAADGAQQWWGIDMTKVLIPRECQSSAEVDPFVLMGN